MMSLSRSVLERLVPFRTFMLRKFYAFIVKLKVYSVFQSPVYDRC